MDAVTMTTPTPTPMPAPELRLLPAARLRPMAAGPAPAEADVAALSPPDPWNEALVGLALAAGRLRNVLSGADADEWPAVMAAHAYHLAKRRARALETELAEPDPFGSRVTCWVP
jgi:hypothetical protein